MEAVDRGKQLLVMTVDIGDGRQDFITVHEHDDPILLAQEFASKYGLDALLQRNLSIMIQENTQEVLKNSLHLREPVDSECSSESPYLSPIKTENLQSESRIAKGTKGVKNTSNNISKNNSKITASKGSIYGAVYKQLRKAASSKSISSTTSQNKSKNGSSYNYGDYLYAKGLKSKEQNEKFKEMKKQELFEKEIHNFTFSPLINTNSSIISPRVYDKPENILMKKKEEKEEKLKKLKEEYEEDYYKECYFTPKINEISKSRDSVGNIHTELYLQAGKLKDRKEKKIEEELKQIPFKPDIKDGRKNKVFETKEMFFDRLESSKKKSEEEQEKLRQKTDEIDTDPVTGQKLFKPLTSVQSERHLSRYNSEPIWEYLYKQKDHKKTEISAAQQESFKQMEAISVSKKASENSDKIFDEFRHKQLQRLFALMDSDCDGKISAGAININGIDVSALKVLTPFFEELELKNLPINEAEFTRKMEEFYRTLNVEEKAFLIRRQDKKEQEEPERKPFISINSTILAEKKRGSLPADFYERQSTVTKMTEMRIQKIREEKSDEAIKDCTFKPLIKTN